MLANEADESFKVIIWWLRSADFCIKDMPQGQVITHWETEFKDIQAFHILFHCRIPVYTNGHYFRVLWVSCDQSSKLHLLILANRILTEEIRVPRLIVSKLFHNMCKLFVSLIFKTSHYHQILTRVDNVHELISVNVFPFVRLLARSACGDVH